MPSMDILIVETMCSEHSRQFQAVQDSSYNPMISFNLAVAPQVQWESLADLAAVVT
jgi:hypothetical protein